MPELATQGVSCPVINPVPKSYKKYPLELSKEYSSEVYFEAALVSKPGSTSFDPSWDSK